MVTDGSLLLAPLNASIDQDITKNLVADDQIKETTPAQVSTSNVEASSIFPALEFESNSNPSTTTTTEKDMPHHNHEATNCPEVILAQYMEGLKGSDGNLADLMSIWWG